MAHDLRLLVDGMLYGGWKSVSVKRSIETLCSTFSLSVTDRWSGQGTPRPILSGAACQILIDDAEVLTGYVDDTEISYDSGSHSISVSGRSKAGDLGDCSGEYFQLLDMTLHTIATRLCKPFGITVRDEATAKGTFSSLVQNPGDSVFATLDAAAKIRGVMLISDDNGDVVITRASNERIPAMLLLGENIKNCSATFSHKDRFSDITVTSEQEIKDEVTYTNTPHIVGKSHDALITRHRPLLKLNNKLLDLKSVQEHADWERNVRFGKSQRIQYTVAGWHYESGKLWPINRMVPVRDEFLGIDDDRLIVSADFILDDGGFRTELVLCPREAYDLMALPEDGDNFATL